MKHFILFLSCFLFLQNVFAQYTQVPDPNFEQALIDLGIDSEGVLDGQFLTADAENVAYLYVDYYNISDLTGIEAFINLEWLDASDNNISEIDLSLISSTIIWTLRLGNNNLSEIDLSQIPSIVNIGLHHNNFESISVTNLQHLYILSISYNPLTNIDLSNSIIQVLEINNTPITNIDLSTNTNLRVLEIHESQIQTLGFTNNPNLEEVRAYNSPLSSINLPNNPNLEILDVDACQLTELDLTNCSSLLYLSFWDNMLTEINLQNNIFLEDLFCGNNQITTIDLTNNPNIFRFWAINNLIEGDLDLTSNPILEDLWLDNNLFTTLDLSQGSILEQAFLSDNPNLLMVNIKNGNNIGMASFFALNCPQFSCLVVDDPLADNDNIFVGANTILVGSIEDCNLSISENELQKLINVYPNPVKEILYVENNNNIEIEKITVYDILGKIVFREYNNPDSYRDNQLNLSELNSGFLFLKIETKSGIIIKKIIKD